MGICWYMGINYLCIFTSSCLFANDTGYSSFISISLWYEWSNERFCFAIFYAPALGTLFYVLHIPITAYFICLVMGIYFLRQEFYFTRDDIGVLNKYLFLIIVFIAFFLLGPQHPYSISKIINIIIIGLISLVYWRAFIQSPYIERIKLRNTYAL